MEGEEGPLGWGLKCPKPRLPPPDGSPQSCPALALSHRGPVWCWAHAKASSRGDPTGGAGSPGCRGSAGPSVPAPPTSWCTGPPAAGSASCQHSPDGSGPGAGPAAIAAPPALLRAPALPTARSLSGWKRFIARSALCHPPAPAPALPHGGKSLRCSAALPGLLRWPFGSTCPAHRRPGGKGGCMPVGPGRWRGQRGTQILPGQPAGRRWGDCWRGGRPGAAPSTPHSCLQKLFSGGGRSRPSMARRWTMCFWMTSRQRVCREGTGRERKEAAELAESPARPRAEGSGGDGPRGSPEALCFRAVVGELALRQKQASSCPGLEQAVRESRCQGTPSGTGA